MAFSSQELYRIKRELGFHTLTVGSLPYIGFVQLFDSVVNLNIDAEVSTTCTLATAIAAASAPTPQNLTLASPTGFAAGSRVVVDVDSRTETVTAQSLSGSVLTVQIQKAHSGTIPVSVEGPITMARECLSRIVTVKDEMAKTFGEGVLKKVDEVEFYDRRGTGQFGNLGGQLMYWRDELASVLGCPNGWRSRSGGSGSASVSVY